MKGRSRGWRLGALASVAVVVVVVAGASVGQSALGGADQSGVLVSGTTDTVTNLDPAGNYDFGSFSADFNIYEQLMGFPNGAKLQPVLATKCSAVGSNKTWRCNLRRGVTFHDGSAFDSADVKHSFDRVIKINDPSGISSLLGNLKSTKTSGKYAVTFTLKSPQSTWPLILATGAGFIVPNSYPATKLQANNLDQIGTGRYSLTKYTPGQQAVYEKFDDYWGAQAKNDGVIVRTYAKSSTMKLAIQRGEIDMAFQTFTPTELASLRKAKGLRVYSGNGAVIRYLVLSMERAPTNNIAVRRALAYAFPRQSVAARVYRGDVKPLFSMPPAGLPGHIDAFVSRYGRPRIWLRPREHSRALDWIRRSRSSSGGRPRTTATLRLTSMPRSSVASRRTVSSRSRSSRPNGPSTRTRSGDSTTRSSWAGSPTTRTSRTTSCRSTGLTRSSRTGTRARRWTT